MKVYQIFIDGHTGWYTLKPDDFEDEIVCNYFTEYVRDILPSELRRVINKIKAMAIGDHVYFENMEFVCFEMDENEFYERRAEY